jgi:hypothetical protein
MLTAGNDPAWRAATLFGYRQVEIGRSKSNAVVRAFGRSRAGSDHSPNSLIAGRSD